MAKDGDSRREALKIIGAIGATCAFPFASDELYGQTEHHAAHSLVQLQQAVPTTPRYFSEPDWKLMSRVADLIIPDTDSPGAVASGVPAYIDYVVGANAQHQANFRTGLAALQKQAQSTHGRDFVALSEEQQIAILTPLSEAVDDDRISTDEARFFAAIKNLTADGYFTSKIGLMDQLGYKGNSVVPDFKGCVHEH
jgi:hypothetical protein